MKTVRLGEICNLMTGGTPSRHHSEYFKEGTIRWLVSGDIHQGDIYDCEGRITKAGLKNSNAKLLPINSVMIALNGQGKTRATVAMLRVEATCNQSLVSIQPKDSSKVQSEWIYWNLKSRYNELRRITGDSGNDRRGLNMVILRNIELPEPPPLKEQQRIVAQLNAAFARIDRAIGLSEKNLQNSRMFFKTELISTFQDLITTYNQEEIGQIAATSSGGTPLRMHPEYYQEGTIPWLLSGEVDNRNITSTKNKITDLGLKSSSAKLFPVDTVVVAMYGATAGQVGILKIPATTNQAVCGILPGEKHIPEYIYYALLWAKDALVKKATGGAQPNISQIKIKQTRIPIPPFREQERIVDRLNTLFDATQELQELYRKKLDHLNALRQSLLQQSFTTADKV